MAARIIQFDLAKDGTVTSTKDIAVLTNEAAVTEAIENILETERRTRVYRQRGFGSDLNRFLFDPIDNTTALRLLDAVEIGISRNEPRARNVVVEITPRPDENSFQIDVEYSVDESNRRLSLTKILKKLR